MKKLILIIVLALLSLSCTSEEMAIQEECDCYIVQQIRTTPNCEEILTRPWTDFIEGHIPAPQFDCQDADNIFAPAGFCTTHHTGNFVAQSQSVIRCF